MSIMNIGIQALQANSLALQTAGNNIANVNTPGYSRQSVVMQTVPGQYTGGGYVGKGVTVQTIQRNFSNFLTRQANIANATASADSTRANYLGQLSNIFPGGDSGLGAAINDMLNSFSDVASAPTDLTARTVTLTSVDETARRMQAASQSLDDLQNGIAQSLSDGVTQINTLAKNIASVNDQISRTQGSGQPPNDLLDQRDQLISQLNQLVQTTTIPADDGTLGVFIGGSQALVLGTSVSPLSIQKDDFGDPTASKLAITQAGATIPLDENSLGGGSLPGLLRFQNTDLNEGRNLLGRLTTAVTTSINAQSQLGLDLNGNVGTNIFTPPTFGTANVLVPVAPAKVNAGTSSLSLSIADPTKFQASDYEVDFTSTTGGTITRRSDGTTTAFDFNTTNPVVIDGLNITEGNLGGAVAGDRVLLKPFSTSASNVAAQFSSPTQLAVSSPVAATLNPSNQGSLAVSSVMAKTLATTAAAPLDNYSVNFTVAGGVTTYDIVDSTTATTVVSGAPFVTGQTIDYPNPSVPGTPGFSLTLSGLPANADTVSVTQDPYATLNSGNASAIMNLRDVATFDGAAMSDGYAGLIGQIGIRAQSANYSSTVSSGIATTAKTSLTAVTGVNLDEEAASLLQYQQAYQASAKMIQIAQTIFTTLITGLGN